MGVLRIPNGNDHTSFQNRVPCLHFQSCRSDDISEGVSCLFVLKSKDLHQSAYFVQMVLWLPQALCLFLPNPALTVREVPPIWSSKMYAVALASLSHFVTSKVARGRSFGSMSSLETFRSEVKMYTATARMMKPARMMVFMGSFLEARRRDRLF